MLVLPLPPPSGSRSGGNRRQQERDALKAIQPEIDYIERAYSDLSTAVRATEEHMKKDLYYQAGRESSKITSAVKRIGYGLVKFQKVKPAGGVALSVYNTQKERVQSMVLEASLFVTKICTRMSGEQVAMRDKYPNISQHMIEMSEEGGRVCGGLKELLQSLVDMM